MANILTIEQIQEEMLKDANNILKRVLTRVKQTGGRVGQTEVSLVNNGKEVFIGIECSLGSTCLLIEEEIKSARLKITKTVEFDGQYDWDADVYMKPSGNVWLKRN